MSEAGAGGRRRHAASGAGRGEPTDPSGTVTGARARFDDRTPGGASFELTGLHTELVARTPDEVVPALRAAEDAARRGHWVAGFVTYEAAAGLDPSLATADWPDGHPLADLPLAWFGAFTRRSDLPAPASTPPGAGHPRWTLDRNSRWHAAAVHTIRAGIAAGDYYQVNLTARLTGQADDIDGLYLALANAQGGAYHGLIVTDRYAIASASPELFFTRDADRVVTQPMKGTATRGRWTAEDEAVARALRDSAKDRAENVMIVDLIRHDLSRIARTGSVTVTSLFDVHRFPTVWQLTSTVAADARPGTDLAELFGALFPCGSVTGAPKATAMAAIARIEGRPRGVYCGAVGYLAPHPQRPAARFNVAIRTVTQARQSGYAEYGAGGGITHASDADAEWAELRAKTTVLSARPRPTQLIETLRFEPPDRLVNLNAHLDRIAGSATYFGFRFDPSEISAAVRSAVMGRLDPARVRVLLHRCGDVHVQVSNLPSARGPVLLGLAAAPIDSRDVLLFHKHGDRQLYDRHRLARPDCDDVILWNERREVTESTIANVAVRLDGRWSTPPLSSGLLPGVQRARLIGAGRLTERVLSIDDVRGAQDIALINSLRGWRDALLIDDPRCPTAGDAAGSPNGVPATRGDDVCVLRQ